MDTRETYAWLMLGFLALIILGLSLYFFVSTSSALSEGLRAWQGGTFVHRPLDELRLARVLAIVGIVVSGLAAVSALVGGVARRRMLSR